MGTPLASLGHAAWSLIALTLGFHATTSTAATTAYMRSTEQLDLRQVALVIVAPDKQKAALGNRASDAFRQSWTSNPRFTLITDASVSRSDTHT